MSKPLIIKVSGYPAGLPDADCYTPLDVNGHEHAVYVVTKSNDASGNDPSPYGAQIIELLTGHIALEEENAQLKQELQDRAIELVDLNNERAILKSCAESMLVSLRCISNTPPHMLDGPAWWVQLVTDMKRQADDAIAQSQPPPTGAEPAYKFSPTECPHESCIIQCNDCGIDFRNAKYVKTEPTSDEHEGRDA